MMRLMGEQQAIQGQVEDIERQARETRELLGRLDKTQEEMREVIEDMASENITDETLRVQERIVSRMLDASVRCTSATSTRSARAAPPSMSSAGGKQPQEAERLKKLRRDIDRALREGTPEEYEELVREYFRAISEAEGSPPSPARCHEANPTKQSHGDSAARPGDRPRRASWRVSSLGARRARASMPSSARLATSPGASRVVAALVALLLVTASPASRSSRHTGRRRRRRSPGAAGSPAHRDARAPAARTHRDRAGAIRKGEELLRKFPGTVASRIRSSISTASCAARTISCACCGRASTASPTIWKRCAIWRPSSWPTRISRRRRVLRQHIAANPRDENRYRVAGALLASRDQVPMALQIYARVARPSAYRRCSRPSPRRWRSNAATTPARSRSTCCSLPIRAPSARVARGGDALQRVDDREAILTRIEDMRRKHRARRRSKTSRPWPSWSRAATASAGRDPGSRPVCRRPGRAPARLRPHGAPGQRTGFVVDRAR